MACSFSDFPVFVLHFGHPKPQALSANLENLNISLEQNIKLIQHNIEIINTRLNDTIISDSGSYASVESTYGADSIQKHTITFRKAFAKIPTISGSVSCLAYNGTTAAGVFSVSNVTQAGFIANIKMANVPGNSIKKYTFKWSAVARV